MQRGLYIAATGMLASRQKIDTITNNIANAETIGYRGDTMITRSFEDLMISRFHATELDRDAEVGPLGLGAHIDDTVTSFVQGVLEETEEQTDMALDGDGFFVLNTPEGIRYTRAGNFSIDNAGNLVNPDGYQVLNTESQPIVIDGKELNVDELGNIYQVLYTLPEDADEDTAPEETTEYVGQLQLVAFADNNALAKQGENLFAGAGAQAAQGVKVRQGFIENSNVNIGREITELLMNSRAFEASQRVVKAIDQTLDRTVNDIARF